jgi:hypothetical protein
MEKPKKGLKTMYGWRSTYISVALSERVEHQQSRVSVDEERVDIESSSNEAEDSEMFQSEVEGSARSKSKGIVNSQRTQP